MCSHDDETLGEPSGADRSLVELERKICALAGHLAAGMCRWLLLVAEFDERLGWAEWGVRSCAHWLSWRCSIGLVAAREHVRVARRLRELPLVREAFAAGELSYCKVRALTRVASAETEESLVVIARHATGAQMEKLSRGYAGVLAATVPAAQRAWEARYLRFSWDDDGSFYLNARVPADEGALLLRALRAFEADERANRAPADELAAGGPDCASAEAPLGAGGAAAARADALVALARAALAGGADSDADGAGRDVGCELMVHVDAATLTSDTVVEQCELEGGPVLAAETARRLACDGAVSRIVERDGRPLSVGRRTRTIPAGLRRALRTRDRGCRFPGCTHERFLHAHHIHHWARGGPTTLENLVHLCSYHHRLVHEGGFNVLRAGRLIQFRRPDGTAIPASPKTCGATGPTLQQQNREHGLQITADTCRALSAGDRLDYGLAIDGLLSRARRMEAGAVKARAGPD